MITKRWIAIAAATVVLPFAAASPTAFAAPGPVNLCNNLQGGTCVGTPGNDTLIAGQKIDHVIGGAGDDDIELNLVFLQGSSDTAEGGPGRDCVDGGGGNTLTLAGEGDDNVPCEFSAFVDPQAALTGGPGDDTTHGGPGDDSMDGIFDSDTLYGDEGDDLINDPYPDDNDNEYGGSGDGNDTCYGDAGDTFENCEDIIRVPAPLLVSPSGPVPLPKALGITPDVAVPPLAPSSTGNR